jgi:hypothetical protein
VLEVRDEHAVTALHETVITKLLLSPFMQKHLAQQCQMCTPQALALHQAALIVLRILPPEEANSSEIRCVAAVCLNGLLLTITVANSRSAVADISHANVHQTIIEWELPKALTMGAISMWLQFHLNRVARTSGFGIWNP